MQNIFAIIAPTYVKHVATSAASTKQNIARNAQKLVSKVQKNAGRWQNNQFKKGRLYVFFFPTV
jgi:meiotically up-regulated gene 157 (Mug157) protein